ncbi:MAG: hypothetical protein ACJARP_003030 [Vicingaceae bacterium]|jgi:hypothetical protein
MKKILLSLLSVFFLTTFFAQVPSNITVYDCGGNSENIYNTLGTGKSVIVLSKGLDCSICRNSAPGWQTWALANTNNVAVWGAITYLYNPAAFPPASMCILTDTWEVTYGWANIFTFPDSNRLWFQASTPKYYVYSAIDSSIAYQGTSSTLARNAAIAQSTVGLNKNILLDAKVFIYNGIITIKDLPSSIDALKIYNAKGQLVFQKDLSQSSEKIDVSQFEKGIYILQFSSPKGLESKKLVF